MNSAPRTQLYRDLDYLGGAGAYADELQKVLGKGPLFESFAPVEIEALCRYLHCYAAPRDVRLIVENDDVRATRGGEEGGHLFIVLTGKVDVLKEGLGRLVRLASLGPGNVVGEMSLIDGEPRYATCVTAEPTDIAVLSRGDFNEMLVTHPRLANKFLIRMLQLLVGRMRQTGDALVGIPQPA